MPYISISDVVIPPDRQRKEGKDSKSLIELKAGIAKLGLFHAPVLTDDHELVVGERRLLAMKELHEEGIEFKYDGEIVPLGSIPFTRFLDIDPALLLEAEFRENVDRLNLTWQEEALAKVNIHKMLQSLNPEQTQTETAEAIVAASQKPVTPSTVEAERFKLVRAQVVASHLNMPAVAQAANITKAYTKVLDLKQQQLERDLMSHRPVTSDHKLIHGDCTKVMLDLSPGTFDFIFSDPPYGIDANKNDVGNLHLYDDSPGNALNLYRFILQRGWNLLKPKGAVFLFCDIEHFLSIRLMAEQQAYSTFRTPIIWHKGSEGHAPWGRDGFKRTYEIGLYCVKGQRELILNGGSDVKLVPRPTVQVNKLHAAEKPPELLRWLLQLTCRHGDQVLDPCCGSAPIFPAAKGLGINITAIEKDPDYHAAAASRLLAIDQESTPTDHVIIPPTMTDIAASLLED